MHVENDSEIDVTNLLAGCVKDANLSKELDLALILGVLVNARLAGKESELATLVSRYGVDNALTAPIQ